jgi:hypothetical protein
MSLWDLSKTNTSIIGVTYDALPKAASITGEKSTRKTSTKGSLSCEEEWLDCDYVD